jgi:hypothetical protein
MKQVASEDYNQLQVANLHPHAADAVTGGCNQFFKEMIVRI